MSRSVRDCSPSSPVASSDHIAVVEVRIRHPMPSMARIVTHGLTTARGSYPLAPGVYLAACINQGILVGPASASCRLRLPLDLGSSKSVVCFRRLRKRLRLSLESLMRWNCQQTAAKLPLRG